jgi:hypothetical protein
LYNLFYGGRHKKLVQSRMKFRLRTVSGLERGGGYTGQFALSKDKSKI